ncbi:hypothetical protein BKA65DRAFT_42242 [Rhexocercosporidium sp. MPI-PUGE-AT-0058]|nr:hypothetical protein BKA65DRAFT_42242 [Rhexocercosporidium sp. MPI-PUGE-AT-0058]
MKSQTRLLFLNTFLISTLPLLRHLACQSYQRIQLAPEGAKLSPAQPSTSQTDPSRRVTTQGPCLCSTSPSLLTTTITNIMQNRDLPPHNHQHLDPAKERRTPNP